MLGTRVFAANGADGYIRAEAAHQAAAPATASAARDTALARLKAGRTEPPEIAHGVRKAPGCRRTILKQLPKGQDGREESTL